MGARQQQAAIHSPVAQSLAISLSLSLSLPPRAIRGAYGCEFLWGTTMLQRKLPAHASPHGSGAWDSKSAPSSSKSMVPLPSASKVWKASLGIGRRPDPSSGFHRIDGKWKKREQPPKETQKTSMLHLGPFASRGYGSSLTTGAMFVGGGVTDRCLEILWNNQMMGLLLANPFKTHHM